MTSEGWPFDLTKARILISNDDGYYAPGLQVLYRIAQKLSTDIWVVAPEVEQSGAGHSLTLRRPLRIREHHPQWFSVDGTPTDCVLLAVNEIMKDRRPDIVFSGVNRGGNLGEDVTYSGTVAAAMEATILGVPAIAFSQEIKEANGADPIWETAETHAPELVRGLIRRGWPPNTLINVNFPAVQADRVSGVKITSQGRRKIGDDIAHIRDPKGMPYYWIGTVRSQNPRVEGTDLAAIADGFVSVTPIKMNMTDTTTMFHLEQSLSAAGEV